MTRGFISATKSPALVRRLRRAGARVIWPGSVRWLVNDTSRLQDWMKGFEARAAISESETGFRFNGQFASCRARSNARKLLRVALACLEPFPKSAAYLRSH